MVRRHGSRGWASRLRLCQSAPGGSTGRARRAAKGARCAGFDSEETHPSLHPACRCRRSGSGRAICSSADPATPLAGHQGLGTGRRLPPSATVSSIRRQAERPWHSLAEGVLWRFDRITSRAPGKYRTATLANATAARVKRSVRTRPTGSQVLLAKDTRMACEVKQMLELKPITPRCAQRARGFPLG
jgi:hypothetical protein